MEKEDLPDIYYTKGWRELYSQKEKDGVPREYFLDCKYGKVAYPYIYIYIYGDNNYYDIRTPYGFNGPIIIECNDKEKLLEEFEKDFNEYCKKEKIVSEYVRFSPWFKNYLDFKKYYDLKPNKKTYAMNLLVDDILMQEISSKRRNQIRLAIKKGVKIEFDFEGKTINDFYKLYQNTIIKNNIKEYYWLSKEFLNEHFEKLKGNVFLANAIINNKIISSSMILHYNKQMHYHYSANDYEYTNLNGNSLLLYEVAKWGKEHGKENFHLGGASVSEDLKRFKLSFTKSEGYDYYVGSRIRNQKVYDELVKKSGKEDSNFFPKYRG